MLLTTVAVAEDVPEPVRQRELAAHALDHWDGDGRFDAIVDLLRNVCDVPIALVSLVEADRQRFLGRSGIDVAETPRSVSFCAHAMLLPEIMLVPDAAADARFANNALVTGAPGIRFYAGAPLVSRTGIPLGALCVIDTVPRAGLTALQAQTLQVLAANVVAILDARREAEARALVARELAHRIKNLFTVVASLIHFAGRDPDAENGRRLLIERMTALASAHELIVPGTGVGGELGSSLHEVMARIFAPHMTDAARLSIAGADLDLDAESVTAMALVFHEMATNAVKYGSLSSDRGTVDVQIADLGDDVTIDWRELGGVALSDEQGDVGFGTRLVDTVVTRQLSGSIERNWTQSGLHVHIRLPRRHPRSTD